MADIVFDDKARAELEGLLPCSIDSTVTVEIDLYKNVDEKYRPKFELKAVTQKAIAQMSKQASFAAKNNELDVDGIYKLVGEHLVGWENLYDVGTSCEIKYGASKVQSFPVKLIMAIYNQLQYMAGIAEREKQALTY